MQTNLGEKLLVMNAVSANFNEICFIKDVVNICFYNLALNLNHAYCLL